MPYLMFREAEGGGEDTSRAWVTGYLGFDRADHAVQEPALCPSLVIDSPNMILCNQGAKPIFPSEPLHTR